LFSHRRGREFWARNVERIRGQERFCVSVCIMVCVSPTVLKACPPGSGGRYDRDGRSFQTAVEATDSRQEPVDYMPAKTR